MNQTNYLIKQYVIANNTSLRSTITLVILKSKWSKAKIGEDKTKQDNKTQGDSNVCYTYLLIHLMCKYFITIVIWGFGGGGEGV